MLVSVLGHPVGTYGVLMALGLLLGLGLAVRLGRRDGLDADRLFSLVVFIFVGSFLGAKLLQVFTAWMRPGAGSVASALAPDRAGAVHGGVLAGLLIFLALTRPVSVAEAATLRWASSRWPAGDAIAPGLALGQAIGRVGCFCAGCCFGTEADLPWAVTFTSDAAHAFTGTPLGVPLHPVQLYMSLTSFAVTGALVVYHRRRRLAGQVLAAYFVLEGLARLLTESFRGDAGRGLGWLGIPWASTGRLSALLFVLVGLALFLRARIAGACAPRFGGAALGPLAPDASISSRDERPLARSGAGP